MIVHLHQVIGINPNNLGLYYNPRKVLPTLRGIRVTPRILEDSKYKEGCETFQLLELVFYQD